MTDDVNQTTKWAHVAVEKSQQNKSAHRQQRQSINLLSTLELDLRDDVKAQISSKHCSKHYMEVKRGCKHQFMGLNGSWKKKGERRARRRCHFENFVALSHSSGDSRADEKLKSFFFEQTFSHHFVSRLAGFALWDGRLSCASYIARQIWCVRAHFTSTTRMVSFALCSPNKRVELFHFDFQFVPLVSEAILNWKVVAVSSPNLAQLWHSETETLFEKFRTDLTHRRRLKFKVVCAQ